MCICICVHYNAFFFVPNPEKAPLSHATWILPLCVINCQSNDREVSTIYSYEFFNIKSVVIHLKSVIARV